jgi:hypothetical protein
LVDSIWIDVVGGATRVVGFDQVIDR